MPVKPFLLFVLACISISKAISQQTQPLPQQYNSNVPYINRNYSMPPADNTISDEYVVGSPFLLKDWAKGSIVTSSGKQINDTSLLINYDKVNRQLVITTDMQSFFNVDVNSVSSFTVFSPEGDLFFYNKPEISKNNFVQLVSAGKNFSVYKKIVTNAKSQSDVRHQKSAYQGGGYYHIVRNEQPETGQGKYVYNTRVNPANNTPVQNDSLVSGGKNYELYFRRTSAGNTNLVYDYKADQSGTADKYVRYEDVAVYYIMENQGDKMVTGKFYLTKNSINNAFGYYSEDKTTEYLQQHGNTTLDDNFVKGIAGYFNM